MRSGVRTVLMKIFPVGVSMLLLLLVYPDIL